MSINLTCIMQCFNENTHKGWDGKTNLERFLESTSKYCDNLIVYSDGSFDNSVDLIRSAESRFKELIIIEGSQNQFDMEISHKNRLLGVARSINSSHVLLLDADEVIERRGENGGIRSLCENMKKGGVNFPRINLWRTDRYYRIDELWAQGLVCRLWEMTPDLYYDIKKGLHQDQAPKGIEGRDTVNLKIIHYGFAKSDDILRKYQLYKRHGQSGRPLDRLVDESTLRVCYVNPVWMSDPKWPYGPETEVYKKPLRSLM